MNKSHQNSGKLRRQRGGIIIWFAVLLLTLLGLAALAVDLSRLHLNKAELQNAADAAALAGALSLVDPQAPPGGQLYNWAAADSAAHAFAENNVANSRQIQDAVIETGYWNVNSKEWSDHTDPGVPASGDVSAVRATITIAEGQNNGPLKLFFAPLLGIAESDMQASAVAMLPVPQSGTGMFPFAFNDCVLNSLWDSDTNSPVVDGSGDPIVFRMQDPYPDASCDAGEWTTFETKANNVNAIRDIMDDGNTTPISVGDDIWILPGTKATLYQKVAGEFIDQTFAIPVVEDIPGKKGWQTVVAIVGFKITGASHKGKNKYVEGHFISGEVFGGLEPGNGSGSPYGAYSPPKLVQ